jgi:hypothetical protein
MHTDEPARAGRRASRSAPSSRALRQLPQRVKIVQEAAPEPWEAHGRGRVCGHEHPSALEHGPSQWARGSGTRPGTGPDAGWFCAEFDWRFGSPPGYLGAQAFAIGVILQECVRKAQSLDDRPLLARPEPGDRAPDRPPGAPRPSGEPAVR